MLRRPVPGWGGIILGNEPVLDEPQPRSLEVLTLVEPDAGSEEEAPSVLLIRVTLDDGAVADYADVTPTELWAAYNFIRPTPELSRHYGELPELQGNDVGLVGITKNRGNGVWDFAIHPAIADTHIARDAMRVDMSISEAQSLSPEERRQMEPRAFLTALSWETLDFKTYQWYDERARVSAQDGNLRIEAAEGPPECLMRLRLVKFEDPGWADSEAAMLSELQRRVFARTERLPAELVTESLVERLAEEEGRAMGREAEEHQQETASSSTELNPHMAVLCTSFDALRTIDRLARVIALLNWYRAASGEELPPLPESLEPNRLAVAATWSSDHVFARTWKSEDLAAWQPGSPPADGDGGAADPRSPEELADDPPGPDASLLLAVLLSGLAVLATVVLIARSRRRAPTA